MNRRNFLGLAIASSLYCLVPSHAQARIDLRRGQPLPLAPHLDLNQRGVVDLTAGFGDYDLGSGPHPGGLLFNEQWPSPTLSISTGEEFDLTLFNQLDEPTIVHWHGLTPPADMDGHPIHAIEPGTSRPYHFTVEDRPGTYWYHPHPHHRTAYQVYHGMAGFLLVDDGADESRGLPTGTRDIPLLLADRRVTPEGELTPYNPDMPEMMVGFLGNAVLVNGLVEPQLEVEPAVIRLRLLNGSTARILNPAFADGRSFWLIGTDAGLLETPVEVDELLLSPGERVEILVDLRTETDATLNLVSRAFSINGTHPPVITEPPQGSAFDLMQINVSLPLDGPAGDIPAGFEPMPTIDSSQADVRTFNLTQSGADHFINGLQYELERVDFTVPIDTVEIWRFINQSSQPHPMHMHGAHFRVLSRTGPATPTDAGWKDTVLVHVGETVDIALRFDKPGLFLLHCHNLEHEDHGMMLNFVVEEQDGPLFHDRFEAA